MSSRTLAAVNSTQYKDFFENDQINDIFLLEKQDANNLWSERISVEGSSYFSLPDDNWIISGCSEYLGDWLVAYNSDNNEPVSQLLKTSFPWALNETVWFCVSKEVVFELSWGGFLKHWDCFVAIDDDCPLVVGEGNGLKQALMLCGIGNMSKISAT